MKVVSKFSYYSLLTIALIASVISNHYMRALELPNPNSNNTSFSILCIYSLTIFTLNYNYLHFIYFSRLTCNVHITT